MTAVPSGQSEPLAICEFISVLCNFLCSKGWDSPTSLSTCGGSAHLYSLSRCAPLPNTPQGRGTCTLHIGVKHPSSPQSPFSVQAPLVALVTPSVAGLGPSLPPTNSSSVHYWTGEDRGSWREKGRRGRVPVSSRTLGVHCVFQE